MTIIPSDQVIKANQTPSSSHKHINSNRTLRTPIDTQLQLGQYIDIPSIDLLNIHIDMS